MQCCEAAHQCGLCCCSWTVVQCSVLLQSFASIEVRVCLVTICLSVQLAESQNVSLGSTPITSISQSVASKILEPIACLMLVICVLAMKLPTHTFASAQVPTGMSSRETHASQLTYPTPNPYIISLTHSLWPTHNHALLELLCPHATLIYLYPMRPLCSTVLPFIAS